MAREYNLELVGQSTRYSQNPRKFSMYFSEPEQGVGEHTGLLLLIAGYGGHAMSRVYQKMRNRFADRYDLLTLQCDYLGYEFMQNDQHLTVTRQMLHQILSPREVRSLEKDFEQNKSLLLGKVLSGQIVLQETEDNFNEMGLWQAMDHLMAVKVLLDITEENHTPVCMDRIYIFGQSHGAYLAYLCNFLSPGLFSGIIDNSAYLFPYFMKHDRQVIKEGETLTLEKRYHYLVSEQDVDMQSYDLTRLYASFDNQAKIVVYHGAEDEMIPLEEKQHFLDKISHVSLHVVSEPDGVLFRSAGHSLGADFFLLFEEAIQELEPQNMTFRRTKEWMADRRFHTQRCLYQVTWDTGVPVLSWEYRQEQDS